MFRPEKILRWLPVPAACAALLAVSASGYAQPVALTGATIHPVSGPEIPNGVLVVEDGLIQSIGAAGSSVPTNAEVVDVTGEHIYPGFVHPATDIGLIEIDSVLGTNDTTEIGDFNTNARAEVAFNADSLRLLPAIRGGVLTAHVIPGGGILTGTSAVMRLEGWNWQDMAMAAPTGMVLNFPSVAGGGGDEDDGASNRSLSKLEQFLDEARAYGKARTADGAPKVSTDVRYEALAPLLAGEATLFLAADGKDQIEQALDWSAEQGFTNRVLLSSANAVYAAERLATDKVPVILLQVLERPSRDFEPYDHIYTAAARLHEAGVHFAIGGGQHDSANARNQPFHAAMAAAFGLSPEVALRSVTLSAAEILGVAEKVGSLEEGKEASFFVANGDPLEILTTIDRVWIRGAEVDLTADHQYRLYKKYDGRPQP